MKPTEIQKKVCDYIIGQCGFWKSTNDISSPTHYCDMEEECFARLEDILSDEQREELVNKTRELFNFIKNIQ